MLYAYDLGLMSTENVKKIKNLLNETIEIEMMAMATIPRATLEKIAVANIKLMFKYSA